MIKLILKAKFIMSEEDLEAVRLKVAKQFETGIAVIPNEFDVLIIKDYNTSNETEVIF